MRDFNKRTFDIVLSVAGLLALWWVILLCWVVAAVETRSNGFFSQTRIGRHGQPFRIHKIKTMVNRGAASRSHVTTRGMGGITRSGRIFRRFKLDELPQLWNVLKGEMSFVGPRPDMPGFADALQGEARAILDLRPGITGPASLHFRNEEEILAGVDDPERYNRDVIWPEKVRLNLDYRRHHSLAGDVRHIIATLTGGTA